MTSMTPYDLAYEYAMHTNKCIFLTGKAGTGKTTFLRNLRTQCSKQIAVVAPTGVAAINAEGVTIHSLFQLPPQVFLPTDAARKALFHEMQMRDQKRKILKNLELLVIDEVSMVRADLLDTIDAVLRHFKYRANLPFGGVQVLFIGDLYQLSPVARREEWELMRDWYQGPYFFQARVFKEITPLYIELDHVFRQTNVQFVEILNQVRNNTLTQEGLDALNSRYSDTIRLDKAILLSTHNHKVDAINSHELEQLKGKLYTYKAEIKHTFPESMYPMDAELHLKVGAKVMFTKNDSSPDKRYFNGKLGVVTSLKKDEIEVTCIDEQTIHVNRETWENIRYVTRDNSDEIQTEVAGTFSHFPLRLAWAITIHKAQGLTFDQVIIDAGDAFASGQVYVALSRCRTLEGITLTEKIPKHALTNAPEVVQFTQNQPAIHQVEQWLESSEKEYFLQLLIGLYDFKTDLHFVERLQHICRSKSFTQPIASDFLAKLASTLTDWQKVAETFQIQLQRILLHSAVSTCPTQNEKDMQHYLQERLKASGEYYDKQMSNLIQQIKSSSISTNDKDDAKTYQDTIEEWLMDLSRKQYLMVHIHEQPSIRYWFTLRKKFGKSKKKSTIKWDKRKSDIKAEHRIALTAFRSAQLLFQGKDIEAIARERELPEKDIIMHIQYAIREKLVRLSQLSKKDKKKLFL